jgi:hypothetical protein
MVEKLTEQELEAAAKTSYAYWYLEEYNTIGSSPPSSSLQNAAAMREARRHLVASRGDAGKALERLKEVIRYRMVGSKPVLSSALRHGKTDILFLGSVVLLYKLVSLLFARTID